jgi:DNA-binding CsgD family transcriptional regulator
MSRDMPTGGVDVIYELWDDLADFGPKRSREALIHCMSRVSDLIGAQNAVWLGAVRMVTGGQAAKDPLLGWRMGAIEILHPELADPRRTAAAMKDLEEWEPAPTTKALLAGVGQHRIYSLQSGMVDLEAYRKTEHYDFFYRQAGIWDRIWSLSPVNEDTGSIFLFDLREDSRFSQEALELVASTMRGLTAFHRQVLTSHGLGVSEIPLTPAEKRLVPELLTGASEKEVAVRLSLTPATAHQYAVGLYRKFGVHGRTEFMALWLRGRM